MRAHQTLAARQAGTVVIGGGQAGYQVAWSLRHAGYEAPLHLICAERHPPYQRPPLSKHFLHDGSDASSLWLADPEQLEELRVTISSEAVATAIDRGMQSVHLADGGRLPYDHLVLATGARNRHLAMAAPPGVHHIRSIDDALALRDELPSARHLVIVGAGFIGLEIASIATDLGTEVDVVELSDSAMARVVSPAMGRVMAERHRERGVRFHWGRTVRRFLDDGSKLSGVELDDGRAIVTSLAVICIGVAPNAELARQSGLAVDNGVVVGDQLHTGDDRIAAIGDCAAFPFSTGPVGTGPVSTGGGEPTRVRLESVQNAVDQAEHVAAEIASGERVPYHRVPWFWSEQFGRRLQIAGLAAGADEEVVVQPTSAPEPVSVLCFRDSRLIAVESVDRPRDHMAGRRLLAKGLGPTPQDARVPGFDLAQWAKAAASGAAERAAEPPKETRAAG